MASTSSEQDKGQSKKRKGEAILNLKVKSQDGEEVSYRANATTKISELKNDYCKRQPFPINYIDFFFDGRQIRDEDTPEQLKMKDGDEIEALIH
ncbi:hypothetical protein IEQ34_002100 [Dendrobium chrysotoxum]|uniref:Small ubiquitin-related modifier n=1 Tax=Dendrobium chrysotoxum TaxID=161865 RepID=A0AAV7HL53_DENCH|nr:hypothetical protein IEQ34_002100 [Dendrobium chrysotoxum]